MNTQDEHTPLTDEILKVIDTGDSNRYAVALRLTTWATNREKLLLEGIAENGCFGPDLSLGMKEPFYAIPKSVITNLIKERGK